MVVRGFELDFQMEWLGEVSEQRKLGKTPKEGEIEGPGEVSAPSKRSVPCVQDTGNNYHGWVDGGVRKRRK